MKLTGRIAVVTGASSGMGAGIAKALKGRPPEESGSCRGVYHGRWRHGDCRSADMSKTADIVRLFEKVKAEYGKVDVLVNNAGVAVFEIVADLTEEAFHKQFNLNVLGYLLAIREASKLFGETGGSIINICSILSTDPYLASSVYSATKGAVDTLTFALARELGSRRIRVNSILPGHMNTPRSASRSCVPLESRPTVNSKKPCLWRFRRTSFEVSPNGYPVSKKLPSGTL